MLKKSLFACVSLALIPACSSTPKTSVNAPVADSERAYVVRDRNPDQVPEWVKDFGKFKRENDGKGQTYFVGESGEVSDRVSGCSVAGLDGRKQISQQVANLISAKIASSKSGQLFVDKDNPNDPGLRRHFEETLAGKSMALLTGVKEYGTFWEERDYSKSGGNKSVYTCSKVLTIDDKSLNDAMRTASRKAPEVVEDPEAKSAVKEALKDIDQAFRAYSSNR